MLAPLSAGSLLHQGGSASATSYSTQAAVLITGEEDTRRRRRSLAYRFLGIDRGRKIH